MNEWYAGRVTDFDDETRVILRTERTEIAVFLAGAEFRAVANTCLHQGGPVGEGVVMGKVCAVLDGDRQLVREIFSEDDLQIVCPWHGWAYDIATGAFAGDRRLRLETFDTEIRGDAVYVIA